MGRLTADDRVMEHLTKKHKDIDLVNFLSNAYSASAELSDGPDPVLPLKSSKPIEVKVGNSVSDFDATQDAIRYALYGELE